MTTAFTYRRDTDPNLPASTLLSTVLATIGSTIILLDEDGIVRIWNNSAERFLGIPAEQALGRELAQLPIAWDAESLQALVPGLVADRPVRLDEVDVTAPDGQDITLAFQITPLPSGKGCLWHGANITERRHMEAQLRQAQKLESIGSLAAGIAHEINTPMQFIGDNTRFLSDAFSGLLAVIAAMRGTLEHVPNVDMAQVDQAERKADIGFITEEIPKALAQSLEGIDRVSRIIKAMKEFSHPSRDEAVPTDLNHAIESTLTVSRNVWKYVAEMVVELDPQLPPVPVMPGGFNQVVLNLIVNAAHAIEDKHPRAQDHKTPSGGYPIMKGVITVRTCMHAGCAVLEVSDTGCGIPAAIRKRIFDPFFTTKEPGRGTGQGLAIVRTEVEERLGGSIEVDSEPGVGTTFRVRLPMERQTSVIRRHHHPKVP